MKALKCDQSHGLYMSSLTITLFFNNMNLFRCLFFFKLDVGKLEQGLPTLSNPYVGVNIVHDVHPNYTCCKCRVMHVLTIHLPTGKSQIENVFSKSTAGLLIKCAYSFKF